MSADFADRDRANYDVESIEREYDAMLKPPRREDAAGAGHHAPHAKRYDLTVEDGLSCIEPKGNGHYVDFDDYEALRRQYDAAAEGYRAALSTAEREREALRDAMTKAAERLTHGRNDGGLIVHDYFAPYCPRCILDRALARVPSGGET